MSFVLVVDDDARSAGLLARLLREDGYSVDVECDGAAALARLDRLPTPDAVITDYRMPFADGMAVARGARLRSPRIPIYIVTAYPELIDEGALDPRARVFAKPLSYSELTTALGAQEKP